MNSKNLAIICFIIIIIAAIGSVVAFNVFSPKETNLEVTSKSNLTSDESFTVKLTSENKSLANQTITVTFKDGNGSLNKVSIKTNENGTATASLKNLSAGKFEVNISYSGGDGYKSSNLTSNLEIKAKEVKSAETNYKSTGAGNGDPDYDPSRDASHRYATEDNPVTVQQSDGVYVYYGPGHYDYYGGDNHMSGEYYHYINTRPDPSLGYY